jgi:peptidoglycan-associated lipoprotein
MRLIGLALALDVALLVVLAGCAQQAKTTTPSTTAQPESPPTPPPPPAVQEQPPTAPPADSAASGAPQNLDEFADEPALKDVLFESNRADIVRDGASIMMGNARWLVARWLVDNRDYFVLLEGHTDAKEAREDNAALAELRAKAAARFLMAMGVPESRLWTVSYGADRPVCKDRSDACAAKNRRVHFRVRRQ